MSGNRNSINSIRASALGSVQRIRGIFEGPFSRGSQQHSPNGHDSLSDRNSPKALEKTSIYTDRSQPVSPPLHEARGAQNSQETFIPINMEPNMTLTPTHRENIGPESGEQVIGAATPSAKKGAPVNTKSADAVSSIKSNVKSDRMPNNPYSKSSEATQSEAAPELPSRPKYGHFETKETSKEKKSESKSNSTIGSLNPPNYWLPSTELAFGSKPEKSSEIIPEFQRFLGAPQPSEQYSKASSSTSPASESAMSSPKTNITEQLIKPIKSEIDGSVKSYIKSRRSPISDMQRSSNAFQRGLNGVSAAPAAESNKTLSIRNNDNLQSQSKVESLIRNSKERMF